VVDRGVQRGHYPRLERAPAGEPDPARRAAHPAGGPSPFRFDFDYSYLDGPEVLVSDEHALVVDAVEDIVLSSQYRVGRVRTDDQELMARWSRRINDVQHLAAHHMAGHDAFVPSDHDHIESKREQLWDRARTRVDTPDKAVQAIDSQ
jgi:hypothetical protein